MKHPDTFSTLAKRCLDIAKKLQRRGYDGGLCLTDGVPEPGNLLGSLTVLEPGHLQANNDQALSDLIVRKLTQFQWGGVIQFKEQRS